MADTPELTDRQRRQLRTVGIVLMVAGVAIHITERRLMRVRTATYTWRRRANMWVDDPGSMASLAGLALMRAGRSVAPKR